VTDMGRCRQGLEVQHECNEYRRRREKTRRRKAESGNLHQEEKARLPSLPRPDRPDWDILNFMSWRNVHPQTIRVRLPLHSPYTTRRTTGRTYEIDRQSVSEQTETCKPQVQRRSCAGPRVSAYFTLSLHTGANAREEVQRSRTLSSTQLPSSLSPPPPPQFRVVPLSHSCQPPSLGSRKPGINIHDACGRALIPLHWSSKVQVYAGS